MVDDFEKSWEEWETQFESQMEEWSDNLEKSLEDNSEMLEHLASSMTDWATKAPRPPRPPRMPRMPKMPKMRKVSNSGHSMSSVTLNGKQYTVFGDSVSLSVNNNRIIVNGKTYTDEDFVDGVLDLRKPRRHQASEIISYPNGINITFAGEQTKKKSDKPAETVHKTQNMDYRGDTMIDHVKNLEEENKALRAKLNGESEEEKEKTYWTTPAIQVGMIAAVAVVGYLVLRLFLLF